VGLKLPRFSSFGDADVEKGWATAPGEQDLRGQGLS